MRANLTRLLLFFCLTLWIGVPAYCQLAQDTLVTNGLRLGLDVGGLAIGLAKASNQKLEFSADWGRKNTFYVAEAGFARKNTLKDNFNYVQNGFYTRIGIEKNTRKGDDALFFGFRYAFSLQTYETKDILINDPYWGTVNGPGIPPRNLQLHWLEGVVGLKVKFWKHFYTGYTVRVKFKARFSDFGAYPPLTVLGYGKPDKGVQVGLSYYVFYKIPFSKK